MGDVMVLNLYVIFLGISSVFSLFFVFYFIKDRNKLSIALAMFALLNTIYTFGYFIQHISARAESALLFFKIAYFGEIFLLPLFVYTMYIISDALNSKRMFIFGLFLVSFTLLLVLFINDNNALFFKSLTPVQHGSFYIIQQEYGVFYYLESIYHFVILIFAGYLIYSFYIRKSAFFNRFSNSIVVMLSLFFIARLISLLKILPIDIDLAPIPIFMGIIIYVFVAQYSDIFYFFETSQFTSPELKSGIIALNDKNELVYYNSTALILLPWLNYKMFGKNFNKLPFTLINFKDHPSDSTVYENSYNGETKYFLFKHYKLPKNRPACSSYFVFNDFTEYITLRQKLELLATRDGLTQIYNQTSILNVAEENFNHAKENKALFSITIFDIDNFKEVNDKYGHVFGNEVLVDIANIIAGYFKDTCCSYGRFGGDEFLIVCNDCNKEIHQLKLNNLVNDVSKMNNSKLNGLRMSVSVGSHYVDFTKKETNETYLEALDKADKRMYQLKNKKKN